MKQSAYILSLRAIGPLKFYLLFLVPMVFGSEFCLALGFGTSPMQLQQYPKDKLLLESCKKLDRPIYLRFDEWVTQNDICDPNFRVNQKKHLQALSEATRRYSLGVDKIKDFETSQKFLKELSAMAEINLRSELIGIEKARSCLLGQEQTCDSSGLQYLENVKKSISENWDKMKEGLALGVWQESGLSANLVNNSNLGVLRDNKDLDQNFAVASELRHSFDSVLGRTISKNTYKTISVTSEEKQQYKDSIQRKRDLMELEIDLSCSKEFTEDLVKDPQLLKEAKEKVASRGQSPCANPDYKKLIQGSDVDYQAFKESTALRTLKEEAAKEYTQQYIDALAKAPVMAFINPKDPSKVSAQELLDGFSLIEAEAKKNMESFQTNPLEMAKYIPLLEKLTADNPEYCDFAEGFLVQAKNKEILKDAGYIGLGIALSGACVLGGGPAGSIICFSAAAAPTTIKSLEDRRNAESRTFATSVDSKFIKDFSEMTNTDKDLALQVMLAPAGAAAMRSVVGANAVRTVPSQMSKTSSQVPINFIGKILNANSSLRTGVYSQVRNAKDIAKRIEDTARKKRFLDSLNAVKPELKDAMVRVSNKLNDSDKFLRYTKDLVIETVENIKSRGIPSELELLKNGELNRNAVLRVLVERAKARGEGDFSTVKTLNPDDPTEFIQAVKKGPFFDKAFKYDTHGIDMHLLQRDYVSDEVFAATSGKPQEFWDLLGSNEGLNFWGPLFDSIQDNMTSPEFTRRVINQALPLK